MSVPDNVRQQLRDKLWMTADQSDWLSLSTTAKSKFYEAWTRDPLIGGLLARYIPLGDVRVYIKDTLLKDFVQNRLADDSKPYKALGIASAITVAKNYVKPHGRRFADGRVICWGRAAAWKAILMAVYERAYGQTNWKPFGVMLTHAVGRYKETRTRTMIEKAAQRLGIERVVWRE
jgi:hypothetical protein